jgi:hypothetical protein
MIGKLTGTLSLKNPPDVLVDCHGVGYEVSVPMSTFYNLPALGEPVTLLTQFIVREDAQLLYGFATAPERQAFRQLIKIIGVGPRTALSILSGMGVGDLAQAITAAGGRAGWSRCRVSARRPPNVCCWSSRANSAPTWGRHVAGNQRCPGRHSAGAAWRWVTTTRRRRCRFEGRCRWMWASVTESSWR